MAKIKFKDGTTGHYKKKATPKITMFQCNRGDKCLNGFVDNKDNIIPAFLNSEEYARGDTCFVCLAGDARKINVENELSLKKFSDSTEKKIYKGINFIADTSCIILETKKVNYTGLFYEVMIYLTKFDKRNHCQIKHQDGNIIYRTNTEQITKEGRDVLYYCKKNKDENGNYIVSDSTI